MTISQRFLTVPEASALLPISTPSLYREVHADRIACLRIGGKYILPARALAVLMSNAGVPKIDADVEPSSSPTGQSFLVMTQAAKLMRVSRWILSREIREGRFPAVNVGGRFLTACAAIDDMEREALASMCLLDVADWTASVRARMGAAA